MINLWRIIRNSWRNFYRNLWLSVATLFMMFAALGVIGGLFLFDASLDTLVSGLQEKVDVSVYFKQDASETDILSVKEELEHRVEVRSVAYISRDDALEAFTQKHAGNEVLIQSLDELDNNPLQASINIKVHDPDQFAAIVQSLEASAASEFIDDINFRENEKVINSISQISDNMNRAGLLFTIVLTALVIFVTFNTIRLAIFTSRDEIHIMKLVGGSNWFVRTPFVITGALYGTLAGLIVVGTYFGGTKFMNSRLSLIFADIDLYGYLMQNTWTFIALILGAGISLGMVSSWLAVRRYLKV
ncbi:MAG: permease-like cell division protein FtsX [Candidatus Spechtbacterales bacterium]|nr:permease-like cell division protein FtsX [Candidatus Spechtbacterales bacterium]